MSLPATEHEVQTFGACDDVAFRRRCAAADRPARLVGAIEAWPARRWSDDAIAARLGDRAVSPVVLRAGRFEVDLDEGVRVQPMRLPEYLAHLAAPGAPPYYLRLPLDGDLRALAAEAPLTSYCAGAVAKRVSLWVGAAGTASDVHFDMTHNLVAQLVGRRRVTLFAPDEAPRLYPHPVRSLNWHHSRVRLDAPDLARFPRFRDARRVTVALEPGMVLFIPRGWWHHFESLETSVAVNCFWVTPRHVPAMALARAAWTLAAIRT
ncbi:MAG: cupin-like domain-containing protein [Polyangiales bacterium]